MAKSETKMVKSHKDSPSITSLFNIGAVVLLQLTDSNIYHGLYTLRNGLPGVHRRDASGEHLLPVPHRVRREPYWQPQRGPEIL